MASGTGCGFVDDVVFAGVAPPGLESQKKSWCYQERDEAERAAWVKALEAVAVCDRVDVDETGCDDRLQREYGWSVRGERCVDKRVGHARERVSVVAAWPLKVDRPAQSDKTAGAGLIAPLSFRGTCHSRLFELWLRVMLCPLLRAGQVVILDNARFHRKHAVQRILRRVGCRALFLPAYSPDLNVIETQWQRFKTRVCAYRLQGLELMPAVNEALL